MGKSSASLKKKRSKNSSKAKASSRRKSGKYKSKKVSRHEVSLSSSDYDSKSVDTSPSSSSEDSYRRKRDRSRTRKDVKGSKKKVRRRSYSRDSSKDSLYARKRKKAKRKNESEAREKPYQKKKIKREACVSSLSSGSRSCSTCQGGSAGNDDDSHYESRRGRSERKGKGKRRLERGRNGNEKSNRYRARSCSSCSLGSGSYDEVVEDKYKGENNSRRLRSVITVTKEAEESGELCRNEIKEEIVDDHDYPCRSNDSNDGGTKRESVHHIFPSSEEKLRVEDEIGDVNAEYNFTGLKTVDRCYNNGSNLKAHGAGASESMKETSETSGANLDGDDLESILRQKALENLKKFRGEIQSTAKASDQKYKVVSQEKQPTTDKHELVQGKYIVNDPDAGTKFNKQTPVEKTSLPVRKRNLIAYPTNNETILNMDKDISGSSKHHLACAPEKAIDADNPSETVKESNNCRTSNPGLTKPESLHDSLQSHSSLKQTPVSGLPQEKLMVAESTRDRGISAHVVSHSSNDNVNNIRGLSSGVPEPSIHGPKFRHTNLNKGKCEVKEHSQFELKQTSASDMPPNAKSLSSEGDVERNAAKTTQAAFQSIHNSGSEVDESCNSATPKSCIESSSVENNSGKLQDGSNQGSQFEQKTMNVMRGGEMVQVSYKVYIPKKAPALARRQLKR